MALAGWLIAGALAAGDGAALYREHCAGCHGKDGGGDGPLAAELRFRPRPFKEGKFAFGNTAEAMAKTVRSGIPDAQGMRMPGFAAVLKEDELAAVVAFARGLMPAEALREGPSAAELELVVGTEAQVVRGALPPLRDGDPIQVRGLLVGLPGGTTFQYDTQEFALVALRHGAFVSRSDWLERGGRPLTPLGEVVWQSPDAARERQFERVSEAGRVALHERLLATQVEGDAVALTIELRDAAGTPYAILTERPSCIDTPTGRRYRRFLGVRTRVPGDEIEVRTDRGEFVMVPREDETGAIETHVATVEALAPWRPVARAAAAPREPVPATAPDRSQLPPRSREADYWEVEFLPAPAGAIEVGGMAFLPDGRLAISTRRGQVWLVEQPLAADPAALRWSLFAEGLSEGLGLAVVDGELLVLQRTELSRLRDGNGDGRCDRVETLAADWGLSGNYHEFAYGLPLDAAGNRWIALNLAFPDPKWWHGKSLAPWRGFVLKVAPDGAVIPWANGLRSPNGLGLNAAGDLFVTDNQGDWMPANPLFHVRRGAFYGHPASLRWPLAERAGANATTTLPEPSDTEPPARARAPAAVWLPYGLSRSAGNPLLDATDGRFGPFAGQLLLPELTNGAIVRVDLEQVEDEYQGACFQLRRDVGSANRLAFAPDGTLFVGLTNRGWGGAPPGDGLARVRFTGRTPMEIASVRLAADRSRGFDVTFTLPLAADETPTPAQVRLEQYDYASWWDYGSPRLHVGELRVAAARLSADRRRLHLDVPDLAPGRVVRFAFDGIVGVGAGDGARREPLLHPQADYTVNRLHGGGPVAIAKTTLSPDAREEQQEGAVALLDHRGLAAWHAPEWRLATVEVDAADPTRFRERAAGDAWDVQLFGPSGAGDAISLVEHGDGDLRLEYCLPEGGAASLWLQGRYELPLRNDYGEVAVAPGEWQRLDLRFRAPRFDDAGRKSEPARIVSAKLNRQVVLQDVVLDAPSAGALAGEAEYGPLRLTARPGPIALRKARWRQVRAVKDGAGKEGVGDATDAAEAGWRPLFDGASLSGWSARGEATFAVESGAIVARGGAGSLTTTRNDFGDGELRLELKAGAGAEGDVIVHAGSADGELRGIRLPLAQGGEPERARTGSVTRHGSKPIAAPVRAALVQDEVWYELRVRFRRDGATTVVELLVNGVRVNSTKLDAIGPGAIELRHAAGAPLWFRRIEVREK